MTKAKRYAGIYKMFLRKIHVEKALYPSAAIKYCKKEDTRVALGLHGEWGTPAKTKLFTGDILDSIKEGATIKQIMESYPKKYMRYGSNIEKMISRFTPRRTWQMKIEIFYGVTGCGKTFTAMELYPNAFWIKWPCGGRWWWDGYEGQEVVIFDEFRHQIKYQTMLRILDACPFKIETKGKIREFTSKKIVITTNLEPMNWYPNKSSEQIAPLLRRFKDYAKIFDFDDWEANEDGEKNPEDVNYLERATPIARDVFSVVEMN